MSALKISSVALLTALTACGGTTGGTLVTLPFSAGGAQVLNTFTTTQGWTVTLQTALIALGPFYFNIAPPATDVFRSGVVIAQVTQQVVVNALDPSLQPVPGGADGETGTAVAVEIDLFPPNATQSSSVQSLIRTNVGFVAGTATKGGTTVQFSGPIAINPNQATTLEPLIWLERVTGAAVDLTFLATPQALELRVDPTHWFDLANFAQLSQGTPTSGVYSWDVSACTAQVQTAAQTAQCSFLTALEQGIQADSGVYLFQLTTR